MSAYRDNQERPSGTHPWSHGLGRHTHASGRAAGQFRRGHVSFDHALPRTSLSGQQPDEELPHPYLPLPPPLVCAQGRPSRSPSDLPQRPLGAGSFIRAPACRHGEVAASSFANQLPPWRADRIRSRTNRRHDKLAALVRAPVAAMATWSHSLARQPPSWQAGHNFNSATTPAGWPSRTAHTRLRPQPKVWTEEGIEPLRRAQYGSTRHQASACMEVHLTHFLAHNPGDHWAGARHSLSSCCALHAHAGLSCLRTPRAHRTWLPGHSTSAQDLSARKSAALALLHQPASLFRSRLMFVQSSPGCVSGVFWSRARARCTCLFHSGNRTCSRPTRGWGPYRRVRDRA